MQSENSVRVQKDQLRRQVGACALCGQPAADQGSVYVRCIETSSRTYRWIKWITRDPKKIKALTVAVAVMGALLAVYVFVILDWPFVYLLAALGVATWVFKSPWSDVPVRIPQCGKHKKQVSPENPGAGNTTSASRFWENRRFRDVLLGIVIAYAVFLAVGALVVATPDNAFDFYWRYFFLPMLLLIPIFIPISLFFGIRRFATSPYGVSSGSDLIEIWHLSRSYCEAANSHPSDVQ